MRSILQVIALIALVVGAGCWGNSRAQRRYFVLFATPNPESPGAIMTGLARVRDLDAESTYDKFQIVVRRTPYELTYRETDVWAVKPNRMISDLIARRLQESGLFSGVTRELAERRPDFTLGGDLHSIEIYDSGDTFFAHLSISLSLARFTDGEVLWTYSFEERKPVGTRNVSHAVRALSELLNKAVSQSLSSLAKLGEPVEEVIPLPQGTQEIPSMGLPDEDEPILVPEERSRPPEGSTSGGTSDDSPATGSQ